MTRAARPSRTVLRNTFAALTIALSGCATFSQDGGFSSVESIARDRLNKAVKWER